MNILFSGFLFIIFVLLIAALAPEGNRVDLIESPWISFLVGTAIAALLFSLIYFICHNMTRSIKKHKNLSYYTVNITLILLLCTEFFILAVQRLFIGIPFSSFVTALTAIVLYFGGLVMYHAGGYYQRYLYPEAEVKSRWEYSLQQIRMWIPFVLPFLFIVFIADALTLFPQMHWIENFDLSPDDPLGLLLFFTTLTILIFLLIIFMPWLIQKLWLCRPLEDTTLWLRLVKIAQKADFRFAGIRTWTIMNQFHSAAILGIIPRFRYVMFTKRLLYELPHQSIEAIFVHEIGHSYRRHLLIIPFIIFGMFVTAGFFSLFFSDGINAFILIMKVKSPSPLWDVLTPLALFAPLALIFALYFRFIFGFFSRLFERQADLHPFTVKTPPEDMVNALDEIGIVTGNTHNIPSWHHYSLTQRITFLKSAIANTQLVEQHHRKVRRWIVIYFIVFFTALATLLSPELNNIPIFKQVGGVVESVRNAITKKMIRLGD